MNILWESLKVTAGIVGQAAVETGMKGKIQAELLLISNEIDARKRLFGVQLYEFVEPLSKTPDFYAANDRMTETLRGPLLQAQREISALDIRRQIILKKVGVTEQEEKTAYINATNWQETLQNSAKKAAYVSQHAKLKAELGMVDVQITDYKQLFGIEMFTLLTTAEDQDGWLPTVRDIRSIYDQTRRDIEKIIVRQKEKEAELMKLGGTPIVDSEVSASPAFQVSPDDPTTTASGKGGTSSTYFRQIATVEAQQQQQQQSIALPVAQVVGTTPYDTQQPTTYLDPFDMSSKPTTTTTTLNTTPYAVPPASKPQQQQQLPPLSVPIVNTATTAAPINPMFAYDTNTLLSSSSTTNNTTTNHHHHDPFAPSSIPTTTTSYNNNNNNTFGTATSQQQQLQFPSSLSTITTTTPQQQQQYPSSSMSYIDPFAVNNNTNNYPMMMQQQQQQFPSSLPSYNINTITNNSTMIDDDPFAMLSTTPSSNVQQQQYPSSFGQSFK